MTKKTKKQTKKPDIVEMDGAFVLKLALYVILGSLWLKVTKDGSTLSLPVPIGLIVGLVLTTHDHFKVDRKIEYAVLVSATLFGYLAPYGLFVAL